MHCCKGRIYLYNSCKIILKWLVKFLHNRQFCYNTYKWILHKKENEKYPFGRKEAVALLPIGCTFKIHNSAISYYR